MLGYFSFVIMSTFTLPRNNTSVWIIFRKLSHHVEIIKQMDVKKCLENCKGFPKINSPLDGVCWLSSQHRYYYFRLFFIQVKQLQYVVDF